MNEYAVISRFSISPGTSRNLIRPGTMLMLVPDRASTAVLVDKGHGVLFGTEVEGTQYPLHANLS